MGNVVKCKVSPQVYRDMALFAKKFDSKQSLQQGLVDKIAPNEKIYEEALVIARSVKQHGTNKEIFKMMKEEAYAYEIECCFNRALVARTAPRL